MSTSLTLTAHNSADIACFADARYPLPVEVENHMPRDIVLPAVPGLFLRHCALSEGNRAQCVVSSYAQLQQLAWDVAQIAQLNHYRQGVSLHASNEASAPVTSRSTRKKESVKFLANPSTQTQEIAL